MPRLLVCPDLSDQGGLWPQVMAQGSVRFGGPDGMVYLTWSHHGLASCDV